MARDENGRFKPGQSGNPKGRPRKGQALTDLLDKHSRKRDVDFKGKRISRKEALSQKLWSLALAGDVAAIKYIFDRIDGKPQQPLDLTHDFQGQSGVLLVPGPIAAPDWDQMAREQQSNDANGDDQ